MDCCREPQPVYSEQEHRSPSGSRGEELGDKLWAGQGGDRVEPGHGGQGQDGPSVRVCGGHVPRLSG